MTRTERDETKTEVESTALLGQAGSRQMPGILILSHDDLVTHANARAAEMLREVATEHWQPTDGAPLPAVLKALVPQLRARLRARDDTSTAALLTVDVCVRACNMSAPESKSLLLVLERVQRRNAVAHNLQRYALSPRECDVTMLVLYGHSNRRIADQLILTEYTVEDHLKRIFVKLGVRSRTALAAKILGWRDPE
jgi:DNA-binding CsgD family transcriptional regulator